MSDAESKILHEMLRAAYRDVNPEISANGDNLIRRLADGLYSRGARVQIGATQPPVYIHIHHSVDPLGNILWTCRRWNQVMGYASQAPVGHHISEFVEPGSYQFIQQEIWPKLVATGKIDYFPSILITSTRDYLQASWKCEILRDERGGFLRTFAKLKVSIPAALARLAASAVVLLTVTYRSSTSVPLLMYFSSP